MKKKIEKLSFSEIVMTVVMGIGICFPFMMYLKELKFEWYKAVYSSGILFWIVIRFQVIVILLYRIIAFLNEKE